MNSFYQKETYDISNINSLIASSTEESIHLDFKAAGSLQMIDKKKNEISKDVSAFANSDGGIIIYGINEVNHVADSYSFIDGSVITKEWLDQVIESKIQRRIPDLEIHPIRCNDEIEKTIYVVKIPKSPFAPHQASDRKFYKRFNFISVPMEEYEIRDVFNRKQVTKLEVEELLINPAGSSSSGNKLNHVDYSLGFQIKNIGNAIEHDYSLEITLPSLLYHRYNGENPVKNYLIITNPDVCVFTVNGESPIFQKQLTTIINARIRVDRESFNLLLSHPIRVILYYTNGSIEKRFKLEEIIFYKGQLLRDCEWN